MRGAEPLSSLQPRPALPVGSDEHAGCAQATVSKPAVVPSLLVETRSREVARGVYRSTTS